MTKIKNRKNLLYLLLGDLLMIVLAFDFSGFTRFGNFYTAWAHFRFSLIMLIMINLLSFYVFTLYEHYERFKSSFFLSRFVTAVIFSFIVTEVFSYFVPFINMGRGLILLTAGYILLFIPLYRFVFDRLFKSNIIRKRVVIVGAGRVAQYIYKVIKYNHNFETVAFLDDDINKHHAILDGIKVLGGAEHLPTMAKSGLFDIAVVAITDDKRQGLLDQLLMAKMSRVQIVDVPTIYEEITGRIPMAHIRSGWLIFTSIRAMSRHLYERFKRYFDIFLSLFGLIIASPVILITAVLIKLDSKGPLIYRQRRVGMDGKQFLMYKFRSMVVDAEKKDGGLYTSNIDPRVTRVGRIIRKIRFDELPQLWNILIGNMSFVGPRPEAVELSQEYERNIQYYSLRHLVKPGLTGWAQVKYRYGASKDDAVEKFEYDMYYLKNMSFFLDIQIILKTISVVILRDSSR